MQDRYHRGDRAAEDDLERPGDPLDAVEHQHEGASTSQLALAWLLQRSPVMVPIPGTSSVAHLEDDLAAAHTTLSDAEMAALADAA